MAEPAVWRNWAGNQQARPTRVSVPADEAHVAALVSAARDDGLRVKPVGSGHSFTGVALTHGVQVRLDRLSGITSLDPDAPQGPEVTVRAGTPLRTFNAELHALGYAMPNLGDVDQQTLAGALSTGTHGTGLALTVLAASIRALRIVTADGTVQVCTPTRNGDLFRAAQVGLGAVGIITEYTIGVVPRFLLRAEERPERLETVLAQFPESIRANDHFEFYWFPHTDRALTKRNNRVGADAEPAPLPHWRARLDDDILSNRVFDAVNRALLRRPALTPRVNQVTARALSARTYTDWSHRVFVTQRDVRFIESEWAFPVEDFAEVFAHLRRWVQTHDETIPFPVEVRVAAEDDLWLSTASGRASCYLAIHKYHRQAPGRYFAEFEAFAREHGGRPHWGKLHEADADYLLTQYPHFAEVVRVRDEVDPQRLFANDYLNRILGP